MAGGNQKQRKQPGESNDAFALLNDTLRRRPHGTRTHQVSASSTDAALLLCVDARFLTRQEVNRIRGKHSKG